MFALAMLGGAQIMIHIGHLVNHFGNRCDLSHE